LRKLANRLIQAKREGLSHPRKPARHLDDSGTWKIQHTTGT
jgi:hypothetical protein